MRAVLLPGMRGIIVDRHKGCWTSWSGPCKKHVCESARARVAFPSRSSSHLVLLHVVAEWGAGAKHGLDVKYDRHISSGDAHRAVPAGDVEFVGGNHVSTYGHRARGDSWVYLGQTVNQVNHQLVVPADAGINGLADLHGEQVGTR